MSVKPWLECKSGHFRRTQLASCHITPAFLTLNSYVSPVSRAACEATKGRAMESFVSREVLRIAGAFRFLTRLPRDETLHFVQPLPYYCPHQHIGMTLVVRFRPQHLETHRLQQDLVFTFIVQPSKFCLVIFGAWSFVLYQGTAPVSSIHAGTETQRFGCMRVCHHVRPTRNSDL